MITFRCPLAYGRNRVRRHRPLPALALAGELGIDRRDSGRALFEQVWVRCSAVLRAVASCPVAWVRLRAPVRLGGVAYAAWRPLLDFGHHRRSMASLRHSSRRRDRQRGIEAHATTTCCVAFAAMIALSSAATPVPVPAATPVLPIPASTPVPIPAAPTAVPIPAPTPVLSRPPMPVPPPAPTAEPTPARTAVPIPAPTAVPVPVPTAVPIPRRRPCRSPLRRSDGREYHSADSQNEGMFPSASVPNYQRSNSGFETFMPNLSQRRFTKRRYASVGVCVELPAKQLGF